MKFKKILLFILIFFFCLFIKNNVDAYVLKEGGVSKFYLEDLPFSEESYKTAFLYNETSNSIMLLGCFNSSSIGYDYTTKMFYHSSNIDNSPDTLFKVYYCNIDVLDNKYIGGNWQGVSSSDSGYATYYLSNPEEYKYIGGTTSIYPSSEYNLLKFLPDIEGFTWNSEFIICKSSDENYIAKLIYPSLFNSSYDFYAWGTNASSPNISSLVYGPSTDLWGSKTSMDIYGYNVSSNKWEYLSSSDYYNTGVGNCNIRTNLLYLPQNINYSGDMSSVAYSKNTSIFSSLFEYNNFPYILNSQEDLAKGEEDIIIMPRRFQKY